MTKKQPISSGEMTLTEATPKTLVEARYYDQLKDNVVQCKLCFRNCIIREDEKGYCQNRANYEGKLYTLVYNRPCAIQIDPIEKEPMYHILPGTDILCIGTASCNFDCRHCHNWHMSHRTIDELTNYYITPEQVVELAIKRKCKTVSFTYNEPTVFFEYMYDIVKQAKTKGLKAIFHTNGSISPEPLKDILKYVDGVTVDLKGFTDEFYKNVSSAKLAPVLNTLKIIREQNVWVEIVNLIIPTLNDDPEDIRKMCQWIKDYLGSETPIHFSRFFPNYKLTELPPTPIETLENAYDIAKKTGMDYVSIGNVPGHKHNSTFCPKCNNVVIKRTHFAVHKVNLKNGKCKKCSHKIPGIWN